MADSTYPPRWGNIDKVRTSFGLSDATIAHLVSEDASFKRVKGNTIEYDLHKIRNHPQVRAFMNKQGSGNTTTISYENILKPRFILPELTDDQFLYVKTIYDYFHVEGKWPDFIYVENTILQAHPEKRPGFDLADMCKDLPDYFAAKFTYNNQFKNDAWLRVPALAYFPEAKEEIEGFIQVIGFCLKTMNSSSEEKPEILSKDLSAQLHLDPLIVHKIGLLLPEEPGIPSGSGSNPDEGWWRMGLQRGKYGIRRYEGVTTFEQYLEKREEVYPLHKAPVTPIPYNPEIALPTPAARPGGTQYHIIQGDQYNISGNTGEVNVKSPSIDVAHQSQTTNVTTTSVNLGETTMKNTHKSPWVSGSFYLTVVVVVFAAIAVLGRLLPWYVFPVALIAGIIVVSVVGGLQLRQDDKLDEENFLKLMALSFKYVPWLKGNPKNNNEQAGNTP